jgi:hypothetical protein
LAFAEQPLFLAVKPTSSNEIAHCESVYAGAGACRNNTNEYQERIHSPSLKSMCSA